MDFRNWNGKKKVLAILGGLLAIVGLVVTVFLVDRVQDLRGRAEKSTTISLNPPTQEVAPGENATLDVVLNPGTNQVNFVKLQIFYDSSTFSLDGDSYFELDPASGMRLAKPLEIPTPGIMIVTLDVGSDPTKVIRTTQRIGTITLPVNSDLPGGVEKDITIDTTQTQVRSIQSNDAFNENVLANVQNAKIIITGGVCIPNVGYCSWDASENATAYHYKVTDTSNNRIVEEGDVDAETTQIEFPTVDGKTYKCEVIAKNECGESSPSEGESTCEIPSATPTPSKTSTPTPSKTNTPTPSKTITPIPTNRPTSTPTPTTPQVVINSPTPTTPQGGVETPTFTPTPTTEIAVSTPIPTLPPTGNPVVITGLIGGFLFLLGGLALLFL